MASTPTGTDTTVFTQDKGAVRVIAVDDGKANAFSVSMIETLISEIETAEADQSIGAVVIAGNQKAFFAGFDLSVIQSGDPAKITELTTAGGELVSCVYGAGIPVVGASTGHAVAAGALLLLGCDQRVGVDAPVKIGLNEVAIALQLPVWALTISVERLSRRHLQRCVTNAQLVDGKGAVDAGFLDEVVADSDDRVTVVVNRAVEIAEQLAQTLDPKAYAGTVRALRGDVLKKMNDSIAGERAAAGL